MKSRIAQMFGKVRGMRVARRFVSNQAGAFYILFAVMLPIVVGMLGLAIEATRAIALREKMITAAESVSLMSAKRSALDPSLTGAQIEAFARDGLAQALGGVTAYTANITVDTATPMIEITLTSASQNRLLDLFGKDTFAVQTNSRASFGRTDLEIAVVMDNTLSINNTELRAIKDAANALVAEVVAGADASDTTNVRFSIVPFQGAVRLSTSNANAAWVDRTGANPLHFEHIPEIQVEDLAGNVITHQPTRWELFDRLERGWQGCFMERPTPHDLQDTPPDPNQPETLFVPYFAPDEPDTGNNNRNNYIDDTGGACAREVDPASVDTIRDEVQRVCKYGLPGETVLNLPSPANNLRHGGPNLFCRIQEMLPLTDDIAQVTATIEGMVNRGPAVTNIPDGMMWGWRALSPGEPLTQGAAYGTENTRKLMVFMTDGENWMRSGIRGNYSALGFPGDTLLSASSGLNVTDSSGSGRIGDALDARTRTVCDNIKSVGIELYMVGFGLNSTSARTLLSDCATSVDHVYFPQENNDLIETFRRIGEAIRALRLIY